MNTATKVADASVDLHNAIAARSQAEREKAYALIHYGWKHSNWIKEAGYPETDDSGKELREDYVEKALADLNAARKVVTAARLRLRNLTKQYVKETEEKAS